MCNVLQRNIFLIIKQKIHFCYFVSAFTLLFVSILFLIQSEVQSVLGG